MIIKDLNWLRNKIIISVKISEDFQTVHYPFWRKSEIKMTWAVLKWFTLDWEEFIYDVNVPSVICVTKKEPRR